MKFLRDQFEVQTVMPHCKKAKKKNNDQNEDEVENTDDEPEEKIKGSKESEKISKEKISD